MGQIPRSQNVFRQSLVCGKRSDGTVNRDTEGAEIETLKASRGMVRWYPLPSRLVGLGQLVSFHSGSGQVPGRKPFLVHFEHLEKRIWCIAIWYFFDILNVSFKLAPTDPCCHGNVCLTGEDNHYAVLCHVFQFDILISFDLIRFGVGSFAYRSNNFIVGLTNVSPLITTPTLWNYTVCGQYPGAVPAGATVSLYCQENLPPFRYVIVQFPLEDDFMNVCEIEVLVRGTRMQNILMFQLLTSIQSNPIQ